MLKIKSFHDAALKNDEAFTFHMTVSALAAELSNPTAVPLVAAYAEAFTQLKDAIDKSETTSGAKLAQEADAERDEAWKGCSAYAKALADYSPDEAKKSAAAKIDAVIGNYQNPTRLALAEETSVLENLIQSLDALSAEVAACDFAPWLTHLKQKQAAYLEAEKQSIEKKSEKVLGEVKTAKTACEDAYANLVTMVNALITIQGPEGFEAFVNKLNLLIDQQKSLAKTRATKAAKKTDATE